MFPTSLLAIFFYSFTMAIGAVATPGPISTAIVSQTPRRGWIVGPLVATGHSLIELLMVILLSFGLVGLSHPGIQAGIALIGGILLIWMGLGMVWETLQGKMHLPRPGHTDEPMSRQQLVGLGMVTTLSNPMWYAWWVTVAVGYLASAKAIGGEAIAAFYLGHISADFAWDTLLSSVIGSGRRWLNDRVYCLLLIACGMFLIYLGVTFLRQSIGLMAF